MAAVPAPPHADVCIVGMGIVGLAIAQNLSRTMHVASIDIKTRSQLNLDAKRYSGVIHAGIYYPPHSFKAFHCVEGKHRLYSYLQDNHVPHEKCGKLIIARNPAERQVVENLYQNGLHNGVEGLRLVDALEARQIEPNVKADFGGLFSASTGIAQSVALRERWLADIRETGNASLYFDTELISVQSQSPGYLLTLRQKQVEFQLYTKHFINCGGCGAPEVARRVEGMPETEIPTHYPAIGHFFRYKKQDLFRTLVYQPPSPTGLGIHSVPRLDTFGKRVALDFGPDVIYGEDPMDHSHLKQKFLEQIRSFVDVTIEEGDIEYVEEVCGMNAKISPSSQDFAFFRGSEHSLPGIWMLFGIDSPGFTSAMSIAETIASQLHTDTSPVAPSHNCRMSNVHTY